MGAPWDVTVGQLRQTCVRTEVVITSLLQRDSKKQKYGSKDRWEHHDVGEPLLRVRSCAACGVHTVHLPSMFYSPFLKQALCMLYVVITINVIIAMWERGRYQ